MPNNLQDIKVAAALIRTHFPSFVHQCFNTLNPGAIYSYNWHLAAIAWHLERVRLGKEKRLIICLPPRSLKSISASVAFPAFIHGHDPSKRIIAVSYGNELSVKLHNDYRSVMNSDWYKAVFPAARIGGKDSENEIVLTGRGGRLATSINGVLTGRGADIIIIDDPLKPVDAMSEPKRSTVNEWYGSTLLSRLDDKLNSAIVIVTQRVHADDLVGHVLQTSPDDWTILNLSAIAMMNEAIQIAENRVYNRRASELLHPEREPQQVLDQIRRDMGSYAFEAQYQQNPVPPGGAMIKREWLRYYEMLPTIEEEDVVIQSWDTASKTGPANDWSVCTTWLIKDNHYYLMDLHRRKVDFPTLKALAIELANQYNPRVVLIEDCGVGTGLIAELANAGIDAVAVTPENSKEARASVQSSKFQSGRVLFAKNAHFLSELETELMSFPGSKHDDQVDSITQALAYEVPAVGGFMSIKF